MLACSATTRRATIVTVSIYVRSLPRARCLTLALPPNGGGPGSHLRFTEVTVGCPLATRARVGRLTTLDRLCSNSPVLVARTVWRARVRHRKMAAIAETFWTPRRFAPRFNNGSSPASQSGHLRFSRLPRLRVSSPSRQMTRFGQALDARWSSPLPHCSARAR